ncbi:phasin family protein [Pontibacterium sp. N1Y112]|uniref:Phasin family protein n=1 Tax=Pontibacterium sinense TaxID=2781979 RepID=A0A8J7FD12_9GAMM|nr:phasin family protein [Pontibacterium sinense]MBE9398807.1 phasin family protein [Pontibacterium sinense]
MYDLMKDVKEKMQPAVDVAEINKKAAEKLFALQSEYVTDFVNSCVSQMKALTEVKEPSQAVELQMTYFKSLETKLADIAEKEYDALNEAKDQITEVVEKSLTDLRDNDYVTEMTKYMNDASETVSKYMNEAAEAVAEAPVVAPAAAPAPAKAAKAATPKKAPAKTSRKTTAAAAE